MKVGYTFIYLLWVTVLKANNIKEIRNKYLNEDAKKRKEAEYDPMTKISGGSKPTI